MSQRPSNSSTATGHKRKRPDRVDSVVLEHRGRHTMLVTCTILNGAIYTETKESTTRVLSTSTSRMVLLHQTLMNLDALRDQLVADMLLVGTDLKEQGFVMESGFPTNLKEWILKHCGKGKRVNTSDFKLDDISILVGQLMLVRHAINR